MVLGSGLDLTKLADTVRQVESAEPPRPVLTCHTPDTDHGWVHLSLAASPGGGGSQPGSRWLLMLGYPSHQDLISFSLSRSVTLPYGSHVAAWEIGLQATLEIPVTVSPNDLAVLIQQVMLRVQHIHPSAPIEVALEF